MSRFFWDSCILPHVHRTKQTETFQQMHHSYCLTHRVNELQHGLIVISMQNYAPVKRQVLQNGCTDYFRCGAKWRRQRGTGDKRGSVKSAMNECAGAATGAFVATSSETDSTAVTLRWIESLNNIFRFQSGQNLCLCYSLW